jgi:hypothetical protein
MSEQINEDATDEKLPESLKVLELPASDSTTSQDSVNYLAKEIDSIMEKHKVECATVTLELKGGIIIELDHRCTLARKLGLIEFSSKALDQKVRTNIMKANPVI